MIELGKKYKDSITGFEGIATARTEYMFGCVRILLEGKKLKPDGTSNELWFDEQRLVPKAAKKEPPGGPGAVAPQRSVSNRS